MDFTVDGTFGKIVFRQSGGSRFMEIPTDTAHLIFDKIALKYPEIALNTLGLFQLGSVGRTRKGKFMNLTTPKHILQSRKNGCTWTSKGTIHSELTEVELCPIEYMENNVQMPSGMIVLKLSSEPVERYMISLAQPKGKT